MWRCTVYGGRHQNCSWKNMRCCTIQRCFFKSRSWRHFYRPRSKIFISYILTLSRNRKTQGTGPLRHFSVGPQTGRGLSPLCTPQRESSPVRRSEWVLLQVWFTPPATPLSPTPALQIRDDVRLKNTTGPLLDPLQFAYRANRSVDDAFNMGLHFILQHLDRPGMFTAVTRYSPHPDQMVDQHLETTSTAPTALNVSGVQDT